MVNLEIKRNGAGSPLLQVKTGTIPLEEGPGSAAGRYDSQDVRLSDKDLVEPQKTIR